MSRLNQQHMQYALRTEMERDRAQATKNVSRYYNHWGQVNSRLESWSSKEYFDKAGKKMQKHKDQKQKEEALLQRREHLLKILTSDKNNYANEMKIKRQPRKQIDDAEDVVNYVKQTVKLGHGMGQSKLNWLDKQIKDTEEREQQEAQFAAEHEILHEQQLVRAEQAEKQRQQMEKELRELQETNAEELKRHNEQAQKLHEEELHFRMFLEELQKEQQSLEQSMSIMQQNAERKNVFNLNKIKLVLRHRAETYQKQVELCISILERILSYSTIPESLLELMNKYKEANYNEPLAYASVDSMYESEAKANLERCESYWREQQLQRFVDMRKLIEKEEQNFSSMLAENMLQQQELAELLIDIKNSSEQLEQLSKNSQEMPVGQLEQLEHKSDEMSSIEQPKMEILSTGNESSNQTEYLAAELPKVSNSFSNLSLDGSQYCLSKRNEAESTRLNNTRSMNVVTQSNAEPPKFARKRVTWN